jgi:prepilin-type N-terminal cleavage/methylation domain-containing protein
MSPYARQTATTRHEAGFTLIEMVIAMALGTFLMLAAFAFLEFTTNDVSRITARAEVDRTGRTALENIMLELHSACVAPSVVPIQPKSSATTIRFISETSPINTNQEPVSALTTVKLHEILYTPAKGNVQGTLTEKMWSSTGTAPTYIFNESEKPVERKLLTGVKKSGAGESTPIFRYYRYYKEGDKSPEYGIIDPNETTAATTKETEDIAKVTINFTLSPEGHEYTSFGNDRPVELEDSTVFRLATSSEAAGTANLPCTQQT